MTKEAPDGRGIRLFWGFFPDTQMGYQKVIWKAGNPVADC